MGDEEAAGARVLAVPEGQMVNARANKMRLIRCAANAAAHTIEAIPIELVWILVDGGIPHTISRDADNVALGEANAV